MRRDDSRDGDTHGAGGVLENVLYDLIPSDDFGRVLSHLPTDATIAVTLSPEKGVDPTLELTDFAVDRGFETVPHIAARFIRDDDHLNDVAQRLQNAGITEIFVPGGDRPDPIGEFSSAYELLVALDELGYSFDEVGITGYPSGHDRIDDETLLVETKKKVPYATYIGTQLSVDSDSIIDWISSTRNDGITLPVEVGIPGSVQYPHLIKMAWQWGAVGPLQFLHKTTGVSGFVTELVKARGRYTPDELVTTLERENTRTDLNIRRLRLLTFNQTRNTVLWHQSRLQNSR